MKKIGLMLLCVLAMMIIFPLTAHADIGPKPSVVIDFNGLDGKTYYATLLSSVEYSGPYSALNENNWAYSRYQEGDEDYEIFHKFAEYKDADGYYFLQYFQECTQTHQFSWTYFPPDKFKILLYFPETDRFIISDEPYEHLAFDSYFTAEFSDPKLSAKEELSVNPNEILNLIIRIVLTIAIELGIALLFGFRKGNLFRFIVLVNVVTQIALNLALNIIKFHSGQMAFVIFYVLLEAAVFVVEAILYTLYLEKHSEQKIPGWEPPVYAFVANAASFILGLWLSYLLPGIF